MFRSLVAKLFDTAPRTPIRRTILRLEGLGDRVMPASYFWHPTVSTSSMLAANWISPDAPGTVPSGITAEVFFADVHAGSLYDCTDFGVTSGVFKSVNLVSGYTGTVTIAAAVTTKDFTMNTGAISQPATAGGSDLIVTENFGWYGGTLNSSENVATVRLDGATGTISPGEAATVLLGSNLSVINAAVLTMHAGTVECINDGLTFTVAQQGGIKVDPGAKNDTVIRTSPGFGGVNKPLIVIAPTAYVVVESGILTDTGAVWVAGGRFTLKNDTTADLGGAEGVRNWAYLQDNGRTELYGGSKLKVAFDMFVNDSVLATMLRGGANQTTDATIQVPVLRVTGGHVYIGENSLHTYGTLTVVGAVDWSGGTYHPVVESPEFVGGVEPPEVRADLWHATGLFKVNTLGGVPVLAPHATGGLVEGQPTYGLSWIVLSSDFMITNVANYSNFLWDVEEVGNPVTHWVLRAAS